MNNEYLTGLLLNDECSLTLGEISRACQAHAEWVIELVEEGILQPGECTPEKWIFSGPSLGRARVVMHLQQDLGINLSGAALVLDLMDEIEEMRARLHRLEYDR